MLGTWTMEQWHIPGKLQVRGCDTVCNLGHLSGQHQVVLAVVNPACIQLYASLKPLLHTLYMYVHPKSKYVTVEMRLIRSCPALVLQVTKAGVRRPVYKASCFTVA